jgi:hypothetical protein
MAARRYVTDTALTTFSLVMVGAKSLMKSSV